MDRPEQNQPTDDVCPHCKTLLPAGHDKFCHGCGNSVEIPPAVLASPHASEPLKRLRTAQWLKFGGGILVVIALLNALVVRDPYEFGCLFFAGLVSFFEGVRRQRKAAKSLSG